jgi:hypothetical protein
MKSRLLLKVLIGAVAAALCIYAGLYVYKSHRYASAFADTRLGDSPEIVTRRFGVAPNNEFLHSGYFPGFTRFPCTLPCDTRLWWEDPTSAFRSQAYYFEFDADRHLIHKTHYEHLDENYLRWMERMKHAPLGDALATEAERFRAAKVVALIRLLEPPQVDPRDSSWGPLSKFLVIRSWKGPFAAGTTVTAATTAACYGYVPGCRPFPLQVGQMVVILGLVDVQPIYQFSAQIVDEEHVEQATRKLDALADLGAERDRIGARLGEPPAAVPDSRH